ncbi:MAG: class I SAM-dependent methyltransferase [Flavobacteriales bacterium]|jgi:SAM-dependent methyltransferase|nr:class I SAM-dependent methyltransferase [Flavobacteriales bacterium]MBK6753711.1 class I SAM-dependent methyltransferase [Flavobacteriales bacterium]MBK7268193.1 class I SAM-dependent methyltransferase [Flavobacteriales bacterium]MBK7751151.1 class I SAM-dependent methyltransferase [Flavobacteriales bacterium]MBK9073492.1 class I SAM-dependent methyltransferase [Flavobacteriales bacterium]
MLERDWDRVAVTFEEEIFNVPANDRRGLIPQAVQRYASKEAVATDLGCGVGRTLPLLADRFGKVYAVDVSSQCLTVAAEACADHPNISYVHADLSKDRNSYPAADLVLCINTLLNASIEVREPLIDRTCRSVKRGGHLLLVVPSLNSALLTAFRHLQWNLRDGMDPKEAQKAAALNSKGLDHGTVYIDGVPTKHYLREELEAMLDDHGFAVESIEKLEYPWNTEFDAPPKWMKAPYPWDWFVAARRVR